MSATPRYLAPTTLQELLPLLAQPGTMLLAGGQTLVPLLWRGEASASQLVDLRRVAGLDGQSLIGGQVHLGAMLTFAAACDGILGQALPQVAAAFRQVGNAPVRNRATIGGTAFLADPGAELVVCALALEARFQLASVTGTRELAAAELFPTPHRSACRPGEAITGMSLPCPLPGEQHGFAEITNRASGGRALALAFVRRLPRPGEPAVLRVTVAGDGFAPRTLQAGDDDAAFDAALGDLGAGGKLLRAAARRAFQSMPMEAT